MTAAKLPFAPNSSKRRDTVRTEPFDPTLERPVEALCGATGLRQGSPERSRRAWPERANML